MSPVKRSILVLFLQFIFYSSALALSDMFGDIELPIGKLKELIGSIGLKRILSEYFLIAIVAPIWEEFVFRGMPLLYVDSGLRKPTILTLVVISSVIWAVFHFHGLWITLALLFTGFSYCWLCLKTRSIWPSMIVHGIWNFIAVTIFVIHNAAVLEPMPFIGAIY